MDRRCLLVVAILAGGCVSSPPPLRVGMVLPAGQWRGDKVMLEVRADGSGCVTLAGAVAQFSGPVRLDIGGHFLLSGSISEGPSAGGPASPANISGRADRGGILWLDVATRNAYPVRSAKLRAVGTGSSAACR